MVTYHPGVDLVVLAAGHGRRFGGLKQLYPVGPDGSAIMDYTARSAEACGFTRIVVIVRPEIHDEVEAHIAGRWPASLPVRLVDQMPLAGTAPAVLSAAPELEGAFAVANADDLYGEDALRRLHDVTAAESEGGGAQLIVAYHLANTVLTDAPVTRGLCEVDAGVLVAIHEQSVRRRPDGGFDSAPLGANRKSDPEAVFTSGLSGDELVSMNLWGFQPDMLAELEQVVAAGRSGGADGSELLLPDAVASLVASGRGAVRVESTEGRCIGLTHPDDVELVRAEVARELVRRDG